MIFQRAPPISLIKLCPERFVLEHDVENISQHFERHNIGLRDHRGRARIKIHARHFAKEIAWTEFGDRIAVCEIHGRIDWNRPVARFFRALVFFAGNESARQPFEKPLCPALCLNVCDRSGNGNFSLAFENVESRGTKFAFAADDFAFAKAPFNDRAAIQF